MSLSGSSSHSGSSHDSMPALVPSVDTESHADSVSSSSDDTDLALELGIPAHPDQDFATVRMHSAVVDLALAITQATAQQSTLLVFIMELNTLQLETDVEEVRRLQEQSLPGFRFHFAPAGDQTAREPPAGDQLCLSSGGACWWQCLRGLRPLCSPTTRPFCSPST